MAMNTTWYPFVELADDLEIENVPAGLRMNAYGTHGGVSKERFELYALAAAVVGKCHNCIASHTAELRKAGRSTEEIAAVGRIAAVVHGVAVVLDTMARSAPDDTRLRQLEHWTTVVPADATQWPAGRAGWRRPRRGGIQSLRAAEAHAAQSRRRDRCVVDRPIEPVRPSGPLLRGFHPSPAPSARHLLAQLGHAPTAPC